MALKITDEQNYQNIADAIRSKLGSSDTFLPSEMADAIESIPQGTASAGFKTKFVDYDGTPLYEYTQEEVDELTELPALPSHAGLICQEWNWSLADIKAMGRQVIVGANYTTDNGRTRIYISIPDYNRTILCSFKASAVNGVKVYWGDGTTQGPTSYEVNTSHTYEEPGDYVIEFEVLSGRLTFRGDMNYGTKVCWSGDSLPTGTYGASIFITKIELGNNVTFDEFALKKTGARTISIPNDIQFVSSSTYGQLSNNSWLKCIVLPKGISDISAQIAVNDIALEYASIPNGVTEIEVLAFDECNSLKSFTFPDSITSVGNKAFLNCKSIEDVTLPATVPALGTETFSGATGFNDPYFLSNIHRIPEKCFYGIDIKEIVIDDDTLVLGNNSINYLTQAKSFVLRKVPAQMTSNSLGNLKTVSRVVLPNNLTVLCDRMFFDNAMLETVELPDSITSIGSDCFYKCANLKKIVLPASLETIGSETFSGCKLLTELIIPAGVSEIPSYICSGMTNLRAFICLGNIVSIGKNSTFSNCSRISLYDFSHCTQVPVCRLQVY